MSIEPGEHCGHVCCPAPHEPHHDHFLSTADCPRCRAIANEVSTSWKEAERLKVQLRTLENARKLGLPKGTDNPLLLALGAAPPVGYNISDAAPNVSKAGGADPPDAPPAECQQGPPHGTADVGVVSGLSTAPTPTVIGLADYLDGYFGVDTPEPYVTYEAWTHANSVKLARNIAEEFTPTPTDPLVDALVAAARRYATASTCAGVREFVDARSALGRAAVALGAAS